MQFGEARLTATYYYTMIATAKVKKIANDLATIPSQQLVCQ